MNINLYRLVLIVFALISSSIVFASGAVDIDAKKTDTTLIVSLGELVVVDYQKSFAAIKSLSEKKLATDFTDKFSGQQADQFAQSVLPLCLEFSQGQHSNDFKDKLLAKVSNHLGKEITLSDSEFSGAWNAMVGVDNATLQNFKKIETLKQNGTKVFIVSETNPYHYEFLKSELKKSILI